MRTLIAFLVVSAAVLAPAQENRDDLTFLELQYLTKVLEDKKTLHIGIAIDGIRRPHTRIAMPNWTPGSYSLRRFGEQVKNLEARDEKGRELAITQLDHQTWSIATAGVQQMKVSYDIRHPRPRFGGRVRGEPTGIHFQAPTIYMYVVGGLKTPIRVRYELPEGWRVANGLLTTSDPNLRRARDYDTFIDAPTILGVFKEHDFEVSGTPFKCVFFSNRQQYDFDIPAFGDICKKIVASQGELFGTFPFPNYVFLFNMSGGGGGLEHLNSTSIGLSSRSLRRDPRSGASITSHEFFHTWNVKRIRPFSLGPFEYEHENYTGNLWVSEGWTTYYGGLTLVRTGIRSRDRYIAGLSGAIRRELNKDSRKKHSVYWASRNVWHRRRGEPARVDYYAKGQILALCIDLEIRNATDNRLSLDDVMRFMNRWFGEGGPGFKEGDVERSCTAVSNHDFSEFFARHVRGTLDPPLKRCLGYVGVDYAATVKKSELPFTYRRVDGGLRVFSHREGSDIGEDGPKRGDVVTAIDGKPEFDLSTLLQSRDGGDEVTLTFQRDGEARTAKVALMARESTQVRLSMTPNPTARQRRIRESWLTGKTSGRSGR